jgi:hypothetical protein
MNLEKYIGQFLRERFPFAYKIARYCYQLPFVLASSFYKKNIISSQIITDNDTEHLFGYYDKSPWDGTEKNILCLSVPFADRHPTVCDAAQILLVELVTDIKNVLGETHAWNLQQGCRLQWLGPDFESKIAYNDFRNNHYISVIYDIVNKNERIIDLPIYDITNDGKTALSLNYERINMFRQGYGYNRGHCVAALETFPENDGIWKIDMTTGTYQLIISFAKFAQEFEVCRAHISATRFKHIMINPSGTRFLFLYRRQEGKTEITSLYTSDMNGSHIYRLETDGLVSHAAWKNDHEILVWARRKDTGDRFYLFFDQSACVTTIGPEILKEDGHPSFSPCNRYVLLDTYADRARERSLYIFDMSTSTIHILGRFYAPFRYSGETRCDLHPRWNRDGSKVCFDSAHEGKRQVYVADLPHFSN